MDASRQNVNNNDLLAFSRETKLKDELDESELDESKIRKLKNVKASFGLKVEFSIERQEGETEYMEHYFHEKDRTFSIEMKKN